MNLVVHHDTPPPRRLVGLARDYDLTAYDASYLELALVLRYPVACRDGGLRDALRAAGLKVV